MTRSSGLLRLATAAELCFERRISALRQIDDAAAALRAEAEALRRVRIGAEVMLEMRGDAAQVVTTWEALRNQRLVDLGRRLAALAALREEARAEVARACGRIAAIRRMTAAAGR